MGQQALKEGHATGARKREERRAAALKAQEKRRAHKKLEKRGGGGRGGTPASPRGAADAVEGSGTEGSKGRRPFPLVDVVDGGVAEAEGAEQAVGASDAASGAIVAVGAACAAMAAIARGGVAAWESERGAVLRRVEATQRARRAAEDSAASAAHRIVRFKTAIDGAAARAAAPGEPSSRPLRKPARVEDIEAGILRRLGLWRGGVVEAERCPLPLLPPGPLTERGAAPGGAPSVAPSRAGGASGAALRFGRQIDPRELEARPVASGRASGAGTAQRLRTQRERAARSVTEQRLNESAAQRFDTLVADGLTPRVHAAQRPRTPWRAKLGAHRVDGYPL